MKSSQHPFWITGSLIGLFFTIPVSAGPLPALMNYFDREISAVSASVCSEPESGGFPSMTFQDVNVDISPSVSFGIDSVLSLAVTPEIDMVFVPEQTGQGH